MSNLVLLICVSIVSVSNAEFIEIDTKLGRIIGNVERTNGDQAIYSFKGIQYGIPPVGNARFRPSVLNESWSNAIYNATTYGKICIQPNKNADQMSEDCLNLNIWTPSISPSSLLPVMFWIHGGGLKSGSGTYPKYNGTNFTDLAQDIIVVTIDYRLGCLGFLASMQLYDEDPKNYPSTGGLNGLGDQVCALNWVKKYISHFGGDPDHITIWGESAGGNSVCMLSVSSHPSILSSNLFQQAISESCSCTGPWAPLNTTVGLEYSEELLIHFNLPTDINKLRQLPANDFAIAFQTHSVDGVILTALPSILYSNITKTNTIFHPNKLIMGYNSVDGTSEQKPAPTNANQYNQYISKYITNRTQVQLIETVYYPLSEYQSFDNKPAASIAWFTMNGDVCVSCPTFQQMNMINNGLMDTNYVGYMYEFRGTAPPYYAVHGADVPFVFDYPEGVTKYDIPWNQNLSDSMVFGWSNFGKTGVPNISNVNIEWKAFDIKEGNVMVFDDNIRLESNYQSTFRHGACLFWYNEVGVDALTNLCHQNLND